MAAGFDGLFEFVSTVIIHVVYTLQFPIVPTYVEVFTQPETRDAKIKMRTKAAIVFVYILKGNEMHDEFFLIKHIPNF